MSAIENQRFGNWPCSWTLREIVMGFFGVFGALAVGVALTADYFGGEPGLGKNEQLALGVGIALLGVATFLRYSAAGGLTGALRFAAVAGQLGLVYVVLNLYDLEIPAFHKFVYPIVICGFLGLHFLPRELRPQTFLLLSLGAMFGIFGLTGGGVMLVASLIFIGICHLPVALWMRIALILAFGGLLAAIRAGVVEFAAVSAILPILASIFMFRLVIYIYDLRNGSGPKDWASRLSYFFMLPNFVFPFFPVVDFTQWGRAQNHDDNITIYQRGVMWIFYGIVHLLLYRAVNYYWSVDSSMVEDFGTFLYYVVTNYALYLKVSGLFHMILGCLFMFGFALPETHGRYYLSSSFIELWRRVNIYWKDFMQKLVFNPAYMAFKKRGASHRGAVIGSVALVFIVTWWTHAYQWFWLVGSWLLTVPDTLFWILLGSLLIVQTLGNERPDRPNARALIGPRALLAVQTVSMMTTLMILWSLWSCKTMGEWFAIIERGGVQILGPVENWTAAGVVQSFLILGFFIVIGTFSVGYTLGLAPKGSHPRVSALGKKPPFHFGQNVLQVSLVMAALVIIQAPLVYTLLPVSAQSTVVDMSAQRLSAREQAVLERGYYESLTGAKSASSLMGSQNTTPADWDVIREMKSVEMTGDFMEYVLKPSMVTIYKEALLRTNSHGMRDREYTLEKPRGTTRIAMLGASRAMGAGVADDEVFDELVETDLTERLGRPVEVLNFGVSDYEPARRLLSLTQKAAAFSPDIVLYIGHANDFQVRHLALRYASGTPRPYPVDVLERALDEAAVTPDMSYGEVRERLKPFGKMIIEGVYAELVEEARNMGAKPVWVYLPSVKTYSGPEDKSVELRNLARQAGFTTISLDDLFKGKEVEPFWLRVWDQHPNALGHRLIADRLADALMNPDMAQKLGLQ